MVAPTHTFDKIERFVVIYLENHSFDNLFGTYPGADGLAAARTGPPQVDAAGKTYTRLPRPFDPGAGEPDPRFPGDLPNQPFFIDDFVGIDDFTPDPIHRFYHQQQQINRGRMDRFVQVSNVDGLVLGVYHTEKLPLMPLAAEFTLSDRFFHAAFGGSFLNHIWLVAAAMPVFADAPPALVARVDHSGRLITDGAVTADGCFAVNTIFAAAAPHPAGIPAAFLLPAQRGATIGDRLSDAGVSWAWYGGGWNKALAGNTADFQFHHHPFIYFAAYADGTAARKTHLKDEDDFLAAAAAGTLPAVSFVKPRPSQNDHPGGSTILASQLHALDLVEAVRSGPNWQGAAIIITYDENGGFWDHVAPPRKDEWGPGTRVPTIIVSPFARKGFVDHTEYDTTSILTTLEHRFGLAPLGPRDAQANDLAAAFDFPP